MWFKFIIYVVHGKSTASEYWCCGGGGGGNGDGIRHTPNNSHNHNNNMMMMMTWQAMLLHTNNVCLTFCTLLNLIKIDSTIDDGEQLGAMIGRLYWIPCAFFFSSPSLQFSSLLCVCEVNGSNCPRLRSTFSKDSLHWCSHIDWRTTTIFHEFRRSVRICDKKWLFTFSRGFVRENLLWKIENHLIHTSIPTMQKLIGNSIDTAYWSLPEMNDENRMLQRISATHRHTHTCTQRLLL